MAMAGNLDNFFAKKDQKKKKKPQCSLTSDKLAKRLELTSRQAAATKETGSSVGQGEDFSPSVNNNTELSSANDDGEVRLASQSRSEAVDDEWVEVEERQIDYNNLKIQKLVLEDQPKREENGEETNATNASAHTESSNPWARMRTADSAVMEMDAAEPEPAVQEPEEPKPADTGAPAKSAYVPPHLRGEKKLAPLVSKRHGASTRPPEIGNITEFPDLMESTGRQTYSDADHNQIETRRPADMNAAGGVSLANRFGSLSS